MKRLPISLLRFLVLAMFLISILPARAQQSVVQLPDIYVTSDNYSIHVSHKAGAHPSKVPVLLIHGSWGNAQTWDFPGRSVMDYLAVRVTTFTRSIFVAWANLYQGQPDLRTIFQ